MVNKKSKRLTTTNNDEVKKLPQVSIKKYCTEKKIHKQKNLFGKVRKNECLRNKKIQNTINSSSSISNNRYNIRKKCIKQSPLKGPISPKKFYYNIKFNEYLSSIDKLQLKEKTTNNTNISEDTKDLTKDVTPNYRLNCFKTSRKTKINNKFVNNHKPYNLVPPIEKAEELKHKHIDTIKSLEVFNEKLISKNDDQYFNYFQSKNSNETQTNEFLAKEYQITQSTVKKSFTIPVNHFYKKRVIPKTNDNEKVNKDLPLISDATFNSKADFNQSPSSKLNNSHKISLHVKHINDTTNNKQQKVTAFFPIRRSARKTKNIVDEEKQIALEKAINSQNEDELKIAIFPNKGRGVIAGKDFSRGEFVVEYAGELVCLQEARKREAIYSQDTSTGCYMYYFKYGSIHYCIDATAESSKLGRLVNHSRFGNLGPKIVEISGIPRIVLIAKTNIKEGEELTYDYGDRSKKSLINHPWLAY